jgi:glucosamine--fructose-6-phosphate aminotransferase (isomerizing)
MRDALFAQPDWLRTVRPDVRFPPGVGLFTGCGTSFHAAQTGGRAAQALEVVLRPDRVEDFLVCVSHEGTTELTREAARAFAGPTWAIVGVESPLAAECDFATLCGLGPEQSWCHTASYTTAVAQIAALNGEDVTWLPGAVARALESSREPVSGHDRWLIAGAGRDWPTAQEAALKLREGAFVAAEAHHTEQLLHGHLAAVDEAVRCFVLEGEGRAAERARDAAAALRELGCEVTLVTTTHPVVDIVRFQLLTLDLAEARGVDPDRIRRDDERWAKAAAAHGSTG